MNFSSNRLYMKVWVWYLLLRSVLLKLSNFSNSLSKKARVRYLLLLLGAVEAVELLILQAIYEGLGLVPVVAYR